MAAVCDGTAYSPSPSPDAGTVPDHVVLRALISITHPVGVSSVLVKASFFSFRFTLAVKAAAPSIAGTHQGIAQVSALPLLVYLVVLPIIIATKLGLAPGHGEHGLNDLLRLPPAPVGFTVGHRCTQAQDSQQQRQRLGVGTPEHLEPVRGGRDALGRRQVATEFGALSALQRGSRPAPSGTGTPPKRR